MESTGSIMSEKSPLQRFVSYLETYRGRDKIIRLCNYALYFASGLLKRIRGSGVNIGKLAAELSNLRVMLRLLDDLAMLQYTVSYGTGSSIENDLVCRVCQVIQNCCDQLYYPVEHIAWARDVGILKGTSTKLWTIGSFCWVLSLSLGVLIHVRKLLLLRKQNRTNTQNRSKYEATYEGSNNEESRKKLIQLSIGLIGNLVDLMNGIHWLPSGILWASKLTPELVGLFGIISTLCSIYGSIA